MSLKLKRPLVVFDLETTGIDVSRDRIVEIAIVKVMPDGSTESKRRLINPEMPIPKEASEIHKITDEMVADQPTFKQVAKSIEDFIKGSDLAGYNSNRFDLPMLVEEFLRAGREFDLGDRLLVDVQHIFHKKEPRDLAAAYKFYCDKNHDDAHSALADTEATWEILKAQMNRYEDLGDSVDSILKVIGQDPIVDFARRFVMGTVEEMVNGKKVQRETEIFNFGKHKGKAVDTILKQERSYYDWMMQGDFPLHTKKKLTEILNRTYLKKEA